jgi:hypothetical protein
MKFIRVFLKGEPTRWTDFPLPANGNFHNFISRMRFEGFIVDDSRYIALDQVATMFLHEGQATQSFTVMAPGQA